VKAPVWGGIWRVFRQFDHTPDAKILGEKIRKVIIRTSHEMVRHTPERKIGCSSHLTNVKSIKNNEVSSFAFPFLKVRRLLQMLSAIEGAPLMK